MGRLIPVLILIFLASGCKKTESDFVWAKSYGAGEARFIESTADSGLIACGVSDGKPYFVHLDYKYRLIRDFSADMPGVFTSAWYDTSGYITCGNTDGKVLMMRHSRKGTMLWKKTAETDFYVDCTQMFYTGDGQFLAIASASPDSAGSGVSGLLFLSFDSTGQILNEKSYFNGMFIAANECAVDNSGNIYMALTRKEAFSESKATVAKFNNIFQRIWETDLANNEAFGAAAMAVTLDASGNILVAGRTELPAKEEVLNNSFLVKLSGSGSQEWKKYPESSNTGTGLLVNDSGEILMLNRNCFVVNVLDPLDGSDGGRIRMFSECDPYSTDAVASDFDLTYENNILLAGTVSGTFYLALREPQQ